MTLQKLATWSDLDRGRLATSMAEIDNTTGDLAASGKVQSKGLDILANGNTVTLTGAADLAGNIEFNLPATTGVANQVLVTDGNGAMNWSNSGTGTVDSVSVTTASSVLAITGDTTITESGTFDIALNTELEGLGALAEDGLVARTTSGAYTSRTITGDANITVTDGNGIAGEPTVSLNAAITVKQLGYALMTTAERDAILTPTEGTIVCTKDGVANAELSVYLGSSWVTITTV